MCVCGSVCVFSNGLGACPRFTAPLPKNSWDGLRERLPFETVKTGLNTLTGDSVTVVLSLLSSCVQSVYLSNMEVRWETNMNIHVSLIC